MRRRCEIHEVQKLASTMAAGWTTEETKVLIGVWGEANVQDQLDNVKRNRDIYERIASQLAAQGYAKSWKQCTVS